MKRYPSPIENLIIGSKEEISEILIKPKPATKARYIVSIGNPSEEIPLGYEQHKYKLRLEFNDIIGNQDISGMTDLVPAQELHIKSLVQFALDIKTIGARGDLLVNCSVGLSRSPGCAIILLRCLGASEKDAIDLTFLSRPQAFPNQQVLKIAASINLLSEKALTRSRRVPDKEKLLELFP